jgi:hypothetical protein
MIGRTGLRAPRANQQSVGPHDVVKVIF